MKNFAAKSSGGAATASRRLSSVTAVGGNLVGLIGDLQSGGDGTSISGVDLSSCVGEQLDIAVEKIVEALTPDNGDADKIKAALEEALYSVLEGETTFDPSSLSPSDIVSLLTRYLAESIFCWIVSESDKAFQKTDDPARAIQAEKDLRELIFVTVEDKVGEQTDANLVTMSASQISSLEKEIVREVFGTWEGYD